MFRKVESGGGPFSKIFGKYFFQTSEAFFPYKGVFVTKILKANIMAFIKTNILRPVLSVTTPPLHVFLVLHPLKLIFVNSCLRFPIFGVLREPPPKKKSCVG